ncbi:trypsin-like peptidase domain-containing protein [Flavobacterium sp. NRK F7]|uniref:trypsin-like peptidase domain-containing protein n=1 Tax=Flavobacterium sp. NRK F7 TaxID=2954930 RepID=UPI0020918824|nr:trypsin-like peptidase domain-containing protein [Flavobacterium sp. NRK F7]MCO6162722.1 trypsin-like peptidase domain-containing protein [Flavobacterium sp. NRK F7]
MKRLGSIFLVALLSGAITLGAYKLFLEPENNSVVTVAPNYTRNVALGAENIDFTTAAETAVHSVVHVKNMTLQRVYSNPMEYIFGYGRGGTQQQMQIGTGSGVIISEDGYIVTNNHVIDNASQLEVTLNNNKSYKAKLIGTDSSMDIALIKIDTDEKLPYIVFGDSENLKVGEWVLAVGNPYNLTSTVTAGIVSAKARDLSNQGLQSFIQTDAAVNPGNSGGALVNTRGELIGINTMISSPTGSYAGYSFAVPSNITRKIIEDLMQFGNVQRGVLGIEGRELNSVFSKEIGVNETQGFYVGGVTKKSGAEKAGIKEGDIIIKIDNKKINKFNDLTTYINSKRPEEIVNVTVLRDGDEKIIPVKLTKKELLILEANGIEFEDISNDDKKENNIDYGVRIKTIKNPGIMEYADALQGSIVLTVDGRKAEDAEKVTSYIKSKRNPRSQYKLITSDGQLIQVIF